MSGRSHLYASRRPRRRRLVPLAASVLAVLAAMALGARTAVAPAAPAVDGPVPNGSGVPHAPVRFRLLTLDPGHFHASLVQKFMYPDVDSVVHVYAPAGDDVAQHVTRIAVFNQRAADPTHWDEQVYTGADFFDRMLADRAGNVVVIAGNNARKTEYIARSIGASLNVLGDKPMARTPDDVVRLRQAFETAKAKHVQLYDIMTERNEITNTLQRELMQVPALFGTLERGTAEDPAIRMESVHFLSKTVAGAALRRPEWFFDVRQEGEGLQDVGTHLVDLVQWEAFPDQTLHQSDVTVLSARRWTTPVTRAQFAKVTGAADFPASVQSDVKDGVLQYYCNGDMTYRIRGVYARVEATWGFEAPAGSGDTHHSVMRGTRATLEIRQGAAESYKPTLYVTRGSEAALRAAVAALQAQHPGIGVRQAGDGWAITVPAKYDVGHEAHFAQVTSVFLRALREGELPAWEVPNMLVKYGTLAQAYTMSHAGH